MKFGIKSMLWTTAIVAVVVSAGQLFFQKPPSMAQIFDAILCHHLDKGPAPTFSNLDLYKGTLHTSYTYTSSLNVNLVRQIVEDLPPLKNSNFLSVSEWSGENDGYSKVKTYIYDRQAMRVCITELPLRNRSRVVLVWFPVGSKNSGEQK